jgi:signal transduction histidine kinase
VDAAESEHTLCSNQAGDLDALGRELVDGLMADMRVKSAVLIAPDNDQSDFCVQKSTGFRDNLLSAMRMHRDGALAKYLTKHSEPIEHTQLVNRLQDEGNTAREEPTAWQSPQLWLPLVKDGALEGILILGLKHVEDFSVAGDRHILSTLARQAAIALQNVRLAEKLMYKVAELDRLIHELHLIREEEQTRLGQNLHDVYIQGLIAMDFRVQRGIAEPELQGRIMLGLGDDIGQMAEDLRNLSNELYPPVLDEFGLTAAVKEYVTPLAGEGEIVVDADLASQQPDWLTREQQICLYRVLQEAIANVRKHSCATRAAVELTFDDSHAALSVGDDGQGFVVPDRLGTLVKSNHFGLVSMEQRVKSLRGALLIDSQLQQGTRVQVQLPRLIVAAPTLVVEGPDEWMPYQKRFR